MNQKLISLNAVRTALVGLALLAFSVSVVAAPPVPTLSYPANNATVSLSAQFSWYPSGSQPTYRIVISQNPEFSGFVDSNGSSSCKDNTCFTATTSSTSYTKSLSCTGHKYYWKVRSNDKTGASGFQYPARSFTTSGPSDSCPQASSYAQSIWSEALKANGYTYYKNSPLVSGGMTYCAVFVRLVHNLYTGRGNAIDVCQYYASKGLLKTGTPPVGAAVCYRPVTSGLYNNYGYGHIGIANGSGQELGVLTTKGVSLRPSPTSVTSYYWGWVGADDFKKNW